MGMSTSSPLLQFSLSVSQRVTDFGLRCLGSRIEQFGQYVKRKGFCQSAQGGSHGRRNPRQRLCLHSGRTRNDGQHDPLRIDISRDASAQSEATSTRPRLDSRRPTDQRMDLRGGYAAVTQQHGRRRHERDFTTGPARRLDWEDCRWNHATIFDRRWSNGDASSGYAGQYAHRWIASKSKDLARERWEGGSRGCASLSTRAVAESVIVPIFVQHHQIHEHQNFIRGSPSPKW